MVDIVSGALALIGALLVAIAGLGVVRLPDLYSRMHAATKATTLGLALVAIAGMVSLDDGVGKLLIAIIFVFITAPVSSHFVGRIAYRADGVELHLEGPDDLADLDTDGPDTGDNST